MRLVLVALMVLFALGAAVDVAITADLLALGESAAGLSVGAYMAGTALPVSWVAPMLDIALPNQVFDPVMAAPARVLFPVRAGALLLVSLLLGALVFRPRRR